MSSELRGHGKKKAVHYIVAHKRNEDFRKDNTSEDLNSDEDVTEDDINGWWTTSWFWW